MDKMDIGKPESITKKKMKTTTTNQNREETINYLKTRHIHKYVYIIKNKIYHLVIT